MIRSSVGLKRSAEESCMHLIAGVYSPASAKDLIWSVRTNCGSQEEMIDGWLILTTCDLFRQGTRSLWTDIWLFIVERKSPVRYGELAEDWRTRVFGESASDDACSKLIEEARAIRDRSIGTVVWIQSWFLMSGSDICIHDSLLSQLCFMRRTVSLCYCNVVQIYFTDSISSSAQRFFVHFLFFGYVRQLWVHVKIALDKTEYRVES